MILINLEALNVQKHGHSWHSNSSSWFSSLIFVWWIYQLDDGFVGRVSTVKERKNKENCFQQWLGILLKAGFRCCRSSPRRPKNTLYRYVSDWNWGIPTSFRVAGKTQSLRVIMCHLGSNIQAETLRMELQQTEGNLDQVSMGEGIWKSGLVRGEFTQGECNVNEWSSQRMGKT